MQVFNAFYTMREKLGFGTNAEFEFTINDMPINVNTDMTVGDVSTAGQIDVYATLRCGEFTHTKTLCFW